MSVVRGKAFVGVISATGMLLYVFMLVNTGGDNAALHDIERASKSRSSIYRPKPSKPPDPPPSLPLEERERLATQRKRFAEVFNAVDGSQRSGTHRIRSENSLPGTADWKLTRPAMKHEIEGYSSPNSVNRGEMVKLFVSAPGDPEVQIAVFRMGWYGGLGARWVFNATVRGIAQPAPQLKESGIPYECLWTDPYELRTASDWTTGFYLARLTGGTSGKQAFVLFLLRDDDAEADFVFVHSALTYQAYNMWGGRSAFQYNSNDWYCCPEALTFNRPYNFHTQIDLDFGVGAGEFLSSYNRIWQAGWEYNFVRWLERETYNVKYISSLELHSQPSVLFKAKAMLTCGHDEFWTVPMRENVEAAFAKGIHIGNFGARSSYWVVDLDKSPANGDPLRTIIFKFEGNKETWRDGRQARPEAELFGVQNVADANGDIAVGDSADHWLFHDTGLKQGDFLRGLIGYTSDSIGDDSVPCVERVTHSPVTGFDNPAYSYSDTTVYKGPSGAYLFSAGTNQWVWGLDDFVPRDGVRGLYSNPKVEQITRNVLARFLSASPPQPASVVADTFDGGSSAPVNDDVWCKSVLMDGAQQFDRYGSVRIVDDALELTPSPVRPLKILDRQVGEVRHSWYTIVMVIPGEDSDVHSVGVMSRGQLRLGDGAEQQQQQQQQPTRCASVHAVAVESHNVSASFGIVTSFRSWFRFELSKGYLTFGKNRKKAEGSWDEPPPDPSVLYSAAEHAFWRFRYDPSAKMIVFETSPLPGADGKHAWTVRHQEAPNRLQISKVHVELSAQSRRGMGTGSVRFDGFSTDCSS